MLVGDSLVIGKMLDVSKFNSDLTGNEDNSREGIGE